MSKHSWDRQIIVIVALLLCGLLAFSWLQRAAIGSWLVATNQVEGLIQSAQEQMSAVPLQASNLQSARQMLLAAIAVDPDDRIAQEQMNRLADLAIEYGKHELAEGNLDSARQYLAIAEQVRPADTAIAAHLETIRTRQKDTDLESLLTQALSVESDQQRSALRLFQTALELDPANAVARAGLTRQLDHLADQAEQALQTGHWRLAQKLVLEIREYDSAHLALPELMASVQKAKKSAFRKQADQISRVQQLIEQRKIIEALELVETAELFDHPDLPTILDQCTDQFLQEALEGARSRHFQQSQRALYFAALCRPESQAIAQTKGRIDVLSEAARAVEHNGRVPMSEVVPKAYARIAQGALIEPFGDSAWDYLLQISQRDPENIQLPAIREQFLQAAVTCFDSAISNNRLQRATICFDAVAVIDKRRAQSVSGQLVSSWLGVIEERLRHGQVESASAALAVVMRIDPQRAELDELQRRLITIRRGLIN